VAEVGHTNDDENNTTTNNNNNNDDDDDDAAATVGRIRECVVVCIFIQFSLTQATTRREKGCGSSAVEECVCQSDTGRTNKGHVAAAAAAVAAAALEPSSIVRLLGGERGRVDFATRQGRGCVVEDDEDDDDDDDDDDRRRRW
jgi:hypothetical protein